MAVKCAFHSEVCFRCCSERCPFVSFKDCLFEVDRKKENTGRAAVARECSVVHSYTLEASFCGSDLVGGNLIHFTTGDLEEIGTQMIKTVAAYWYATYYMLKSTCVTVCT